jgi:fructan beta-fructosidase
LPVNGETVWVLLVSINPGGPNGGSATQYFTGNFDGSTFTPRSTETKWVDYGPDDYAGVTWSNTGNRKIFLGWMSNWQYANLVPTDTWRNAMTVPRDLALKTVANNIFLTSQPVRELQKIISPALSFENIRVKGEYDLSPKVKNSNGLYQLKIRSADLADFSIVLSNTLGEELVVGFDRQANQYYIDRSKSGKKDFEKDFAKKHTAPRLSENENIELTLLADAASIELFADEGLTVMTEIFFPNKPLSQIRIKSSEDITLKTINYADIKSAWNSTAMVK